MVVYFYESVDRCVLKLAAFMKRAMSKRVPCTILYASETGTSEQCAYKLQKMFDKAFNVRVCWQIGGSIGVCSFRDYYQPVLKGGEGRLIVLLCW